MRQDESSRIVTAADAQCTDAGDVDLNARAGKIPTTSDDAVRLAIKLAVDAGEYDRAATLLDVLRRAERGAATVTRIDAARDRKGGP